MIPKTRIFIVRESESADGFIKLFSRIFIVREFVAGFIKLRSCFYDGGFFRRFYIGGAADGFAFAFRR